MKSFIAVLLLCLGTAACAQQSSNQQLTLNVSAAISISTTRFPNAITATPYSKPIVATGGTVPYSFSITTGTLPAGLTLDPVAGTISGTPTTAGSSNFTVQAKDASNATATANLGITVVQKLIITTTTLPGAVLGQPFTGVINFTGGTGPFTCTITTGTLPAGLTVSNTAQTCVISGAPTVTGSFTFTLTISDSTQTTSISIKGTAQYAKLELKKADKRS